MIVMAAEALFSGYSIRANDLSDLVSTVPPNIALASHLLFCSMSRHSY